MDQSFRVRFGFGRNLTPFRSVEPLVLKIKALLLAIYAHLTSSLDHFFLCFLGSIRVLKPQNGYFSALSEPSVRFSFNELRFGKELTRKRSLVRIQS